MAPRNCAFRLVTLAAPFLLLSQAASVSSSNDRTVTQVVKLLQGMLDQSKTDGDSERDLYAKYKCYYDTNEAKKTEEIEHLTELIGLLENKIEQLLASATELSNEIAKARSEIASTEQARSEAQSLRNDQNTEFLAKNASLEEAIGQMKDAIEVLAEVGADQTGGEDWDDRVSPGDAGRYTAPDENHTAQDHRQFMAGYQPAASLSALKSTVRTALVAASALAGKKQLSTIDSFLQDPFTGTYTAQSGEVVGILKDMRWTFITNQLEGIAAEEKALKAFNKYMRNTQEALDVLEMRNSTATKALDDNDGELGAKRDQLELAQQELGDAQTFLASLRSMYEAKTQQYNERVSLRRKEETALAEAISILNSDAAFATFGTVSATRTGATSFVQFRAIHSHDTSAEEGSIKQARAFLQRTAAKQHSPLLGRILALLQTRNPFAVVLKEIDKMIELIAAEEKADDEQQGWCDQERTETDAAIVTKTNELDDLASAIHILKQQINDPQQGLLAQQASTEASIENNHNTQVSLTETRKQENHEYQKDVENLVSAEALLKRATQVLRAYYSKISDEINATSLLQGPTEPEPPSTWDDKYSGQSGPAVSVIDMLDFIVKNTQQEETQAHDDEVEAQRSYEESIENLKRDMDTLQGDLSQIKATLALKRQELKTKEKDHAATSKEKTALENYLEKIKPGCDYITDNIDKRKANRAEETGALEEAKRLLRASPAHMEAEAQAHQESLGACAGICNKQGEDHVDCKACLAKVSVPGYCAGHPGTQGC